MLLLQAAQKAQAHVSVFRIFITCVRCAVAASLFFALLPLLFSIVIVLLPMVLVLGVALLLSSASAFGFAARSAQTEQIQNMHVLPLRGGAEAEET